MPCSREVDGPQPALTSAGVFNFKSLTGTYKKSPGTNRGKAGAGRQTLAQRAVAMIEKIPAAFLRAMCKAQRNRSRPWDES